jgi:ABC-type Fe3+/spermidine/putrescine transport system ATPase subunit
MTLLQVLDAGKKGPGDFALSGITFSQQKLERIAIAGETGAGKSTLMRLIAGLLQPDEGQLLFEGRKIIGPEDQLVPGHPGIAYLSQHFELQKSLRVEQVLAYSNTLSGRESDRLFSVCRIKHLLLRRTDQLSGGEKQRVAVCRLLISRPQMLLLDEPFSHLDMVHKDMLKSVIRDIGGKLKITCMLVSHDPLDTLSWADKIIVLRNGHMVQAGTPESIYNKPVDEYAGGLFGDYNLISRERFRTFAKLPVIKAYLKKNRGVRNIFLRPENFKLVRKNPRALRGKVEKILFFGSHRQFWIRVSVALIKVKTTAANIQEGELVYLSLSKTDLWSF